MSVVNNVYLYWIGNEFKLIKILRSLIYAHSHSGRGYQIHLINHQNVNQYVPELPDCFFDLCPAFQADYVRVSVVCDRGGIWLDSDTLVMESLDSLFGLLETQQGFFVYQANPTQLINGVFGSRAGTPLMKTWKEEILKTFKIKNGKIYWSEIGNEMLDRIQSIYPEYFKDYRILGGTTDIYPVHWTKCVDEFLNKPYDNYKQIVRDYQPLIILVNSVYKTWEKMPEAKIFTMAMPLNYFIVKSIDNIKSMEVKEKLLNELVELSKKPEPDKNNSGGTDQKCSIGISPVDNSILRKHKFETIYREQIWNNGDPQIPLSGPSASISNSQAISDLLSDFIQKNNIKKVYDLGCGDLTWVSASQFFLDNNIEYIGVDIVPHLITEHQTKYPTKKFLAEDIVESDVIDTETTTSSIVIMRDLIAHLSIEEILKLFQRLRTKCNFIAITNYNTNNNNSQENRWVFSKKNIHIEPFNVSRRYLVEHHENQFDKSFLIYAQNEFFSGQ